jgi:hypothetical protein
MLALWPLLRLDDLDATFPRWLRAARPLIAARQRQSALLAANYLTTFKLLEVGKAAEPSLADDIDPARIEASLLVTGPASIRSNLGRGVAAAKALDLASAASSRAAMRHAMSGGRDTITATVSSDRDVIGWARVASGQACSFCAMLASRGPVYGNRSVDFKTHDGCGCTAEPVYRKDNAWPPNSDRYKATWDQAKAHARDEDIRTDVAFRRLLEGRATQVTRT